MNGGVQRITMPREGVDDKLMFTASERTLRAPFAIYLDFESSIVPVEASERRCGEATERLSKHVANSYCARVVGPDGMSYGKHDLGEVLYRGPNAARKCLEELLRIGALLKGELQTHRERPRLTPEDEAAWCDATVCHICAKDGLTPWPHDAKKPEATSKVRDHCHVTGAYRGAAHSACNLKARTNYDVSVFVHNLKGYDSHLLFQEMADLVNDETKLKVIATNTEKYVSFKLGNLVFKDSCQFLASSLDKLVKNLTPEDLKHARELAAELEVDVELLRRKGVYPYQWVDSPAKFEETALPPIEAFYNDLTSEACKTKDYKHAIRVWEAARCKTFGDYHDLYLRLDVALLTDVYESFRRSAHKTYGLDPAHYYTLPGFAWDALFKYTGVTLDLLTDPDMGQK